MGKRDEQHTQRRWQILQIALDEFIIKGYYGTSTREISKKAGISSGLMFHYFDTKVALYEALIEIGCSKMTLEYTATDSAIHVLEQKLNETLQMIAANPFAAKMFVFMGYAVYNSTQISQKAGEMIAQHDIIRQCVPLIQKGQQFGEIRHGNPHALSIAFWCSIQGIAESIALNSDIPKPKADWILDILRSREEKL